LLFEQTKNQFDLEIIYKYLYGISEFEALNFMIYEKKESSYEMN